MLQDLQTKPVEDDAAQGEMLRSFFDPARVALYEPRKQEAKPMNLIVQRGKKIVVCWLSDENKGSRITSSTFRNVRTPLTSNRADPTLFSSDMVADEQALQSRMLVTHPSLELGDRVLHVGTKHSCVQVLTVVDFIPVSNTVGLTRLDLQVSNTHFGDGEPFPNFDSTCESQYQSRTELPLIEKSITIGSDHAVIVLREGQMFWKKNGDTLFACLVLDATDPLHPLCLLSKESPGPDGFGAPVPERIHMLEETTGVSLFTVSKSQIMQDILCLKPV
jgi:hypothetical protein